MNRKKSLSAHLSRRGAAGDEFAAAIYDLLRSSDRVAAILGGALVETCLQKAITATLADPTDEGPLFHDQGAPFGTFRARIIAGNALGLFDRATAGDMDRIRDIRNQFAHAFLSIDFMNPHIIGACERIRNYPNPNSLTKGDKSSARMQYENACWTISDALMDTANALLEASIERTKSAKGNAKTSRLQSGPNDILSDIDPD